MKVTKYFQENFIWECKMTVILCQPQCVNMSLPGVIMGLGSANERRRYIVMSSLIGWMHTRNEPCRQMRYICEMDSHDYAAHHNAIRYTYMPINQGGYNGKYELISLCQHWYCKAPFVPFRHLWDEVRNVCYGTWLTYQGGFFNFKFSDCRWLHFQTVDGIDNLSTYLC